MNKNSVLVCAAFACGMAAMAVLGNVSDMKVSAQSKGSAVEKEFINPSEMGFTQVVSVKANGVKTLYISGQVGFGDDGIPETIEEQADLAFKNLVAAIEGAGATVEDVIKINTYIKDLDRARGNPVGAAKAKYFTQENQPASTWVGVTSLIYPQFLVEVEAVAVVEDN